MPTSKLYAKIIERPSKSHDTIPLRLRENRKKFLHLKACTTFRHHDVVPALVYRFQYFELYFKFWAIL
jgi:hypothetical protein